VGAVTEYQWKAPLACRTGGIYCYRPLLAGADLLGANASPQFQTQVAAGDTSAFSFDVFGDWGQVDANGNNADQGNLFARVAASGARFAVTVGGQRLPEREPTELWRSSAEGCGHQRHLRARPSGVPRQAPSRCSPRPAITG